MSSKVLSALGLVCALGCQSETPGVTEPSRASAALQALSARDDAALAQCGRATEACNERLPDAAPAGVCERLAEHCERLQAHLAEVRAPAVGCWKGVRACEEHAADAGQCSSPPEACEPLDTGASEDGATVIECGERVEACLTRVAELPDAAAVSCDNVAAACERVAELAAQAGRARAAGASNAADVAKQARDEVDELDESSDDEDAEESEDEGAEEADELEGDGKPADAGTSRLPPVRAERGGD